LSKPEPYIRCSTLYEEEYIGKEKDTLQFVQVAHHSMNRLMGSVCLLTKSNKYSQQLAMPKSETRPHSQTPLFFGVPKIKVKQIFL